MRKVYIDSDAFELALQRFGSGALFERDLASRGMVVSIGSHVIYEFARCFLNEEKTGKGRRLFTFLSQIADPFFVLTVGDLIKRELDSLTTGFPIIMVPSYLNNVAFKQEINKLARGNADDARRFITRRERDITQERPRLAELIKRGAAEFFRQNPKLKSSVRSFPAYKQYMEPRYAEILAMLTPSRFPRRLINRVVGQPSAYPLMTTWLYCQLYLNYIPAIHQDVPARDKLGDLRHVIAANFADVFVTGDNQLLKVFPELNPFREVCRAREFLKR